MNLTLKTRIAGGYVVALLLMLVGGWANTAFVQALVMGDVVRVMLLFYLAPVWSVLGGRLFLGEAISRRRALAVVLALVGLWFVIGGSAAWAKPLGTADWLALSAGLAFAGNNLISRAAQAIPMTSKTVAVFFGCGLLSGGSVLMAGAEMPPITALIALALAGYAFIWLLLATVTWQYGVTHLESGRAGLILLVVVTVVADEADVDRGEEREHDGLNQTDEELHEIEDEDDSEEFSDHDGL